MIVDTSAVVAVVTGESDADQFWSRMRSASRLRMSAASYVESGIVIDAHRDPVLSRELDELLTGLGVEVVPVSTAQARAARQAYRDFGKGSGHPAQLNFGDCFSFALTAEAVDETLLYKGTDFRRTGIRSAVPG